MSKKRKFAIAGIILTLILMFIATYLMVAPVPLTQYKINSFEKLDYSSAKKGFEEISAKDDSKINEKCRSKFMDQGKKTAKVIVLFHGFTNCPAQYEELAKKFFTQGYNVFIPRLPYHGYSDRITNDVSNLRPADLIALTEESMKIASGLGDEVIVGGISGGGVMAAWAGYHYDFVNKAVLMAPLFLAYDLPEYALGPLVRGKDFIPFDSYKWWDDKTKEKIEGPQYAYPRFSFKASFQFLELSFYLKNKIESSAELPNKNLEIIHIKTANDKAVNNGFNDKLVENWSKKLNREALTYEFPDFYNFNHDFIDPNQSTAKPEIAYPKVFELVEK